MSSIQQMLAGGSPAAALQALTWAGNYIDTVTLTPGNAFFTSTASNTTGDNSVYSDALPATGDLYWEVTLSKGSTTYVGFLGVTNKSTTTDWHNTPDVYEAWYWGGTWFGGGAVNVAIGSNLTSGTYRLALNRTDGRLYMKRMDNTPSGVYSAAYPSGTLRATMLCQSGNPVPDGTIVGGSCYGGSGGLF